MAGSGKFQFGMQRVLISMTAVGIILGISRWLGGRVDLQIFVAAYLGLILVWAFFRLPNLWADFQELRNRRQRNRERLSQADDNIRKPG